AAATLTDLANVSDRGWNRTIDLLVVTQTSLPLDHAIVFCCFVWMTEVGVEPTKSRASHACRFASLRTRPTETKAKWRVRGAHPTFQAYEARMSTGSPAVKLCSCQSDPCGDRTRIERLRTFHPAARRTGHDCMGGEGIEPLVCHLASFKTTALQAAARITTREVAREGVEPSKSRRFELR